MRRRTEPARGRRRGVRLGVGAGGRGTVSRLLALALGRGGGGGLGMWREVGVLVGSRGGFALLPLPHRRRQRRRGAMTEWRAV